MTGHECAGCGDRFSREYSEPHNFGYWAFCMQVTGLVAPFCGVVAGLKILTGRAYPGFLRASCPASKFQNFVASRWSHARNARAEARPGGTRDFLPGRGNNRQPNCYPPADHLIWPEFLLDGRFGRKVTTKVLPVTQISKICS